MKDRRDKCVVSYWAPDMIGFNESVEVGKSADLFIDEKQKPYRDATGIIIDYEVDGYGSHYAKVRGLVTNIKAVYIDEYANNGDGTYNCDIPNNKFHIIEIDYADGGLNDTRNCGNRNKFDVKKYIITLQNVVIDKYEDFKGETSHGRLIWVEPGDEKEELFWAGFGGLLGDTHGLRIYSGRKKKKIHFPTRLQKELSEWRKDYWEHVNAGYELWSLNDWRKWWVKGWGLIKEVRSLLPENIIIRYGTRSQPQEPVCKGGLGWELNYKKHFVRIITNMTHKIKEGIYIPRVCLDWSFDLEAEQIYKFEIPKAEHHFFPHDYVVLKVWGWPLSEGNILAKVIECQEDGIIVQAYDWVDLSEEYSIELID